MLSEDDFDLDVILAVTKGRDDTSISYVSMNDFDMSIDFLKKLRGYGYEIVKRSDDNAED